MPKRKHKDNAARQREYRQRQRNAAPDRQDRRDTSNGVTQPTKQRECPRRMFIGRFFGKDYYAEVVSNPLCPVSAHCDHCDAQRK